MRLVLVAAVLLLVVPAPANAASCGPRSAYTWVENSRVRVYEVGGASTSNVRVCHKQTRRSFDIHVDTLAGGIEQVEVAGDFVAVGLSGEDARHAYRDGSVELINARTRKSVFEDSILDARVLDIAAAPSGRIAYLVRVGSERYLYVARNRRAMLDSASGPELRGLRVVRGRLTWVSGGGRQAYPFR